MRVTDQNSSTSFQLRAMFGKTKQHFDPYSRLESGVEFLEKFRAEKEKCTINFLGTEIIIFPGVYSPKHDILSYSKLFISNMPSPHKQRVLDIGTGTGLYGLFAAMKGASLVHATDINPQAVENARANFQKHNFGEEVCLAYQSDLFQNVHTTFDLVLTSPPHQGYAARDMLERALIDENYSSLKRFFSEVGDYLSKDGVISLLFSEFGDMNLMEQLITKSAFFVDKIIEGQEEVKFFVIILKRKPQN